MRSRSLGSRPIRRAGFGQLLGLRAHDGFGCRGRRVLVRGVAVREPRVGEARGDREHLRATRRDRERHARLLDAARDHARVVDGVVGTAMRRRRRAEELVEHFDELGEARHARRRRRLRAAEHGGVESRAAGAETQRQPPAGHVVEGHRLLGQGDRVPEVGRRHHRAEPDAVGGHRQAGEPGDGGVPVAVAVAAPRQVVVRPEVVVAEALQPLRAFHRGRPRIGREHQDADAHLAITSLVRPLPRAGRALPRCCSSARTRARSRRDRARRGRSARSRWSTPRC